MFLLYPFQPKTYANCYLFLVFPDLCPDNVFDFQQIKLPAKLLENFLYFDKVFDVEHIELPRLFLTK